LTRLVRPPFSQRSKPPDACPAALFCAVVKNAGAGFSKLADAQVKAANGHASRSAWAVSQHPSKPVFALIKDVASPNAEATIDQ